MLETFAASLDRDLFGTLGQLPGRFLLFRARLRCFLPGGPPELPFGVLESPGRFIFAIKVSVEGILPNAHRSSEMLVGSQVPSTLSMMFWRSRSWSTGEALNSSYSCFERSLETRFSRAATPPAETVL